ncbi:MAG TPA: hypothetical protein VF151_10900 [Gemmatimonadales bacterium]
MAQTQAFRNVFRANSIVTIDDPAYGVKNDGATADASAVQSLVDALPDGAWVFVPKGDGVRLDASVNLNGRQDLCFTGPGKFTIDAGVEGFVVDGTVAADSVGVKWDGPVFTGTATSTAVSIKNTAGQVLDTYVQNCRFETFLYCVRSQYGNGNIHEIYVQNNRMKNVDIAGSIGVLFDSGDNEVSSNIILGFEKSVRIDRGAVKILCNHFYRGDSTSTVADVEIGYTGQHVCAPSSVIGNYFDGQPTTASLLLDAFYARGTTVTGNTFLSTGAAGPFVLFDASGGGTNIKDFIITGNIFQSSTAKTNTITFNPNAVHTATSGCFIDKNTWYVQTCTPFRHVSDCQSSGSGNRAGAVDGSIKSFTLPAQSLYANGNVVRIIYTGFAGGGSACAPILKFGATTLASISVSAGKAFRIEADVVRSGASAQIANVSVNNDGTMTCTNVTPAEDTTADITVDFRGSSTTGTMFANVCTMEVIG